jgi:hypothetical protein
LEVWKMMRSRQVGMKVWRCGGVEDESRRAGIEDVRRKITDVGNVKNVGDVF